MITINGGQGRIPKKRVIINLGDPQNKFGTKSGPQNKFGTKSGPQNKFGTKSGPQNKFGTKSGPQNNMHSKRAFKIYLDDPFFRNAPGGL
ncbi:MAG: hypothetical protein DRR00_28115 [Candidatus Parabeggiatoa sp. nov. 3]|nr:MAG: hypothetical protein DRR00_28115 [Gammaproteobacteria bacterium]